MPAEARELPRVAYVHPDQQIIDEVLVRRAPDLGLTLRRQLGKAIAEEATLVGYDPLLIVAIIDVESDFQEEAVSNRGARGLMQIQPTTLHFLAQKQGLKLSRDEVSSDPALCVRLGIRYLKDLQDRFRGDLDLALMAYNAGPTKLRAALKDRQRARALPALPGAGAARLPAVPRGPRARRRLGARAAGHRAGRAGRALKFPGAGAVRSTLRTPSCVNL